MILANPLWLLIVLLVPLPWLIARHKGYLGFPNTRRIQASNGWILHVVPVALLAIGFAALSIALARPQKLHVVSKQSFKSRDILIGVDISGSMAGQFGKPPESVVGQTELDKDFPGRPDRPKPGQGQPDQYGYTREIGQRRIDNAQAATLDFIRNRFVAKAGDRIGLFVFDTDQYWHWPLTHDLKMIYRKIHFADEGLGGGTNFGSSPPGPLDAACEHLDDMGRAATRVLIMVTDCEDSLYGGAFDRLSALAAKYRLKLYVVVVGSSQQQSDITRLAEATGGKGFRADNPTDLKECFNTIDKMEQSTVTVETAENREELFFYFAYAAVGFLLLGTIGEALVLNR